MFYIVNPQETITTNKLAQQGCSLQDQCIKINCVLYINNEQCKNEIHMGLIQKCRNLEQHKHSQKRKTKLEDLHIMVSKFATKLKYIKLCGSGKSAGMQISGTELRVQEKKKKEKQPTHIFVAN